MPFRTILRYCGGPADGTTASVPGTPISAEVTERLPGPVSAGGEPLPTHLVVHVYRRSVRVAADGAVLSTTTKEPGGDPPDGWLPSPRGGV